MCFYLHHLAKNKADFIAGKFKALVKIELCEMETEIQIGYSSSVKQLTRKQLKINSKIKN